MTWKQLFETRSVSEQLFPLLEKIDTTQGMYRTDNEGVTNALVDAGYVIKPELRDFSDETKMWEQVIEYLISLDKKEHLILPHSMFPESDAFSRKEDLLLPVRYDAENPLTVSKNLERKIKNVSLDNKYVGYDIQGVFHTDRYYRTTTLIDCIRGKIMQNSTGVNFIFSSYKSPEVKTQGANVTVGNIPSIDSDAVYEIALERIAVYDPRWGGSEDIVNNIIRTSYNLETKHTCSRITRKSGFARKSKSGLRYGTEVDFDHHVIAAFKAVKKDLKSKGFTVIDPFFEPNYTFFELFQKFNKNMLIEHEDSAHIQRMPMTLNEMEIVLWKYMGYNNSKTN